jgi:hypothetical protein
MTEDTKQMIQLHLSMLKQIMKEDGVIFGIAVYKKDFDKTMLCFLDKESLKLGKHDGITVSLDDLNEGLL